MLHFPPDVSSRFLEFSLSYYSARVSSPRPFRHLLRDKNHGGLIFIILSGSQLRYTAHGNHREITVDSEFLEFFLLVLV